MIGKRVSPHNVLRTPRIVVVAILLLGATWLGADQRPGLPSQDAAAVLARRQAYLQDLRDVLGAVPHPAAHGAPGPEPAPFLTGFQAAFQDLRALAGMNHFDRTWEEWQQRTGELPPDFASLPSRSEIPDPLVMLNSPRGARITTVAQWKQQRALIQAGFEQWIFGRMPPSPTNMRAVVTGTRREGDVEVRDVRLEFGPNHQATLRLQLMIPPGPGPFPVFMTNHPRVRPWVNVAVRRGYLTCFYYAGDSSYVGRDDSNPWGHLYPEYDFTMLGRWAWAAMRAVDYLQTVPFIDRRQIATAGHSRNSKSALLAAAFDERIGAVAASRGNAGDSMPFRYNTFPFLAETLEELTDLFPTFLHPRARFFVGHEDKLPVDINLLQAMVAPRGLLLSHAYTEHQANALAIEQSYRSAKSVYQFLGQPKRISLYQQPGEHPASAEDIEVAFDFFDSVFGRANRPIREDFVHGYTFANWRRLSGQAINPLTFPVRRVGDFLTPESGETVTAQTWPVVRRGLLERIQWALGKEPPGVKYPNVTQAGTPSWMTSEGFLGQLVPRKVQGVPADDLAFGDNLKGELYPPDPESLPVVPAGRGAATPPQKWPVVIWLHPESYGTGYARYAYWAPLLAEGIGVFVFDQIGFGSRSNQALNFYERYPQWSLMGKMVTDTRAAIDAVSALAKVDPSRIYVVGLGMGAQVGLMTTAMDDRIAGVATVTGLGSLRSANAAANTEGIKRYSHLHGFLPRLGFFLGNEARLPVDFDEVLAAIAPRPVLAVAPTMDRYYPVDDVRQLATAVEPVYRLLGKTSGVDVMTPKEFSRFPNEIQKLAYDWIVAKAKR